MVTLKKRQLATEVFEFILRNWNYFEGSRFYSAQSVIYICNKTGKTQAEVQSSFALVAKSTEWAVLITTVGHTRGNLGRMVKYVKGLRARV